MDKQLLAHIGFHLRAHRMAEIGVDHIACHTDDEKYQQPDSCQDQPFFRLARPFAQYLSCNVTGQKGEQKSSNGAEGSEKHIHDKNVPIGTVVGKKFFQSLFGKL